MITLDYAPVPLGERVERARFWAQDERPHPLLQVQAWAWLAHHQASRTGWTGTPLFDALMSSGQGWQALCRGRGGVVGEWGRLISLRLLSLNYMK